MVRVVSVTAAAACAGTVTVGADSVNMPAGAAAPAGPVAVAARLRVSGADPSLW